ncbi:spore germination protein [Lederbergia wuyishanensis]|uniref:Spore germination protein KA n=1 Tax=Lederbergia wuyishanensis TaxID=1347903 RepID=A0ABU0D8X0_9BACI|nr:spore germination protein [Lederbergia wuyishanensis]MCJ8007555.1 spore germination protein [Lederbergia wuyishanensis]MDQ0344864.1 spore germination protein KA [Lederbergia wuyishanensis]
MSGSLRKKKTKKENSKIDNNVPHVKLDQSSNETLNGDLKRTVAYINNILGENDDFINRKLTIFGKFPAVIFYISNMVDQSVINNDLIKPILFPPEHLEINQIQNSNIVEVLAEEVIYHSQINLESKLAKLVQKILAGETVIAIDGVYEAFHHDTHHIEKRAITQPETEQVIIGPREGFIERLDTNIGLIRYRLPTPDFCVKKMRVGRITKSKVAICYLKGIADPALVDEVEKRLSEINVDAIMDVGYLEQYLENYQFSPFPQTILTERPDSVVGNIIEGRVVVLVDGSPFALMVPVIFNQFYQTTEDYSTRFLLASFTRVVRILALVFSLVFPALYVSFISFNPELLPTEFAVAVAGGRAGVPFPAVVEVLMMEVAMEVLREATVRLPKQIGGALSIVGVLVIGQAAVDAGLSSPITVVVIAITTIGSFATPVYNASFALRMLRFPLAILAGLFGLYGVMVGIIVIFNHMLSLKSFGVPYMSPVSPGNLQGMKDVVIRFPFRWMPRRPEFLHPNNDTRTGKNEEIIRANANNMSNQTKVSKK